MALEQARKQSQAAAKKAGPQGDNPLALLKDANQFEGIMKTLSGNDPAKDGQVMSFTIERGFGSESWSGMRLVEAALPGFEDVSSVGDRAMIGAFGHAFYVMKGDTMIRLDTTLVPDARITRGADQQENSREAVGEFLNVLAKWRTETDCYFIPTISRNAASNRSTSSTVL